MQYVSICIPKSTAPKMLRTEDMPEFNRISKDELLHKKCRAITYYEMKAVTPQKLMIIIETDEPDALNLLSRDLGNDWRLEISPLHQVREPLEEDHSIIGG